MKKLLIALLTLVMVSTNLSIGFAVSNDVTIKIDNQILQTEPKAYISPEGRTMIPVRFVSEALQCTVDWDGDNRIVTINQGNKKILLKIGDFKATIDDKVYTMDTKAIINQDRTFVPFRFISEALGYKVDWENSTRTVFVYTKEYTVNGYTIPTNPASIVDTNDHEQTEIMICIDYASKYSIEKQQLEAYEILKSKFGEDIATKILNVLKQKTDRFTGFNSATFEVDNKIIAVDGEKWTYTAIIRVYKKGV